MLCPRCKNNVDSNHAYCSKCGYKMEENIGKSSHSWFKTPGGILTLLALSCFVGAILGMYGLVTPGVIEDTIDNQLKAIKENHFTQAYYDYTDKGFQSAITLDEF